MKIDYSFFFFFYHGILHYFIHYFYVHENIYVFFYSYGLFKKMFTSSDIYCMMTCFSLQGRDFLSLTLSMVYTTVSAPAVPDNNTLTIH